MRATSALARAAAAELRILDRATKHTALVHLADELVERYVEILEANSADIEAAGNAGARPDTIDRLSLSSMRVEELAYRLRTIAALPDPIGEVVRSSRQRVGLRRSQIRVPIGVIAVPFDGQPAVLLHAAGLLLKTGNAVLLHDVNTQAAHTEAVLANIVADSLAATGVPRGAVQLLPGGHRAQLRHLLTAHHEIDLVIPLLPRGIPAQMLPETTVPVVELGPAHCHVYIDSTADIEQAKQVVLDSKFGYQAAPQAVRTLLIHADLAAKLVPALYQALSEHGVSMHGDDRFTALAPGCPAAGDEHWTAGRAWHKVAGAVVDTVDEAISHINRFGTGHTETVVTRDNAVAHRFSAMVDAAAVTVNAPTTYGDTTANLLDPDLGFATQRLRPRGPLSLTELTTTKWVMWPADEDFDLGQDHATAHRG